MKFLILLSITLSMSIIFLLHPMSLGFILLSQTIITSLIIGMISFNFWFSYIMFLIMIGGMLILFIYMTSIASNEKFMFSNMLMIMFMMTIMLMITLFLIDNFLMNLFSINSEMITLNKNIFFYINMNKYISSTNLMISILTIIYLLITLIAVVKISNFNSGPLRQIN
nr:NADH dehydrogenase subunit 6 [Tillus nitidus]